MASTPPPFGSHNQADIKRFHEGQFQAKSARRRNTVIGGLVLLALVVYLLFGSAESASDVPTTALFVEADAGLRDSTDVFAARTNMSSDIAAIVRQALKVKDPKAACEGFVGDASNPLRSTADISDYVGNFENFFAWPAQTQVLRPVFQAHRDRPARFAMVTAWGGKSPRLMKVVPATIFLKVLYCRRVCCDIYVGDTGDVLKTVGANVTDDSTVWQPLVRFHQWAKPVMVATYLPHYEWVVWQDPDILPIDFDWTIFDHARAGGEYEGADFIAGFERPPVPMNTGQYYAKRSAFTFHMLQQKWDSPNQPSDQGALTWILHRMPGKMRKRMLAPLLRVMGGWLCWANTSDTIKHFRYSDPVAHFTPCRIWDNGITHLTITALALNGLYTGTPPSDLFFFTRPRPTVIGARTFNVLRDPKKHADALEDGSIAVVTLPPTSPLPIHRAIRDSWVKYCTEMGYAFEEAPLQGLWDPYEKPRNLTKMRWRAVQEVLPYYSWVVFVDPDVAVASATHRLSTLINAQVKGASGRAVDWIAAPLGHKNLSGAAFVVRRSQWSLKLLEELYYDDGADHNAAVANVFPPLDKLPLVKNYGDRRGDKNPMQAWTDDFSRVAVTKSLVGMPTSMCKFADDVVDDCGFEHGRKYWFVRVPPSACGTDADLRSCETFLGPLKTVISKL